MGSWATRAGTWIGNHWREITAAGLFVAVAAFTAWPLRDWLIDDAGISFAFSRSLALGHGLVPQPGADPIEAYSNTTWVLIVAPLVWLGLFDPYIIGKLFSLLLLGGAAALLYRPLAEAASSRLVIPFLALVAVGTQTGFAIWTTSGLENPLYFLLLILLTREITRSTFRPIALGVVCLALAFTRPDGILWTLAVPLAGLAHDGLKAVTLRSTWRTWLISGGVFVLGYSLFLAFRVSYFGEWWPMPYYAKGGLASSDLLEVVYLEKQGLSKLRDLFAAVAGPAMILPVILLGSWGLWSSLQCGVPRALRSLAVMTVLGLVVYAMLPVDWMREFRFATPVFGLGLGWLVVVWARLVVTTVQHWSVRLIGGALGLILLWTAITHNTERMATFSENPTVPLERIANNFGHRINDWTDRLGLDSASLLVPDLGGALLYSDLTVYDLAGLADSVIARHRRNHWKHDRWNMDRFYQYVFEELKPTYIATHGSFTMRSQWDVDGRLYSDYLPIEAYVDRYASDRLRRTISSGVFFRKATADSLGLDTDSLQAILLTP